VAVGHERAGGKGGVGDGASRGIGRAIAAAVAVLLAANGYVTGQTVNVNGGWYLS
jgi:hypothetical protein